MMISIEAAGDFSPERSPYQLSRMAAHEAGHVVAHLFLDMGPVRKIPIMDDEGAFAPGSLNLDDPSEAEAVYSCLLILILSGRAAEEEVCGSLSAYYGGPARTDLRLANDIALELETTLGLSKRWPLLYRPAKDRDLVYGSDQDLAARVNSRLEAAYHAARNLVARERKAIEFLSEFLLEQKTLHVSDLDGLIEEVKERMAMWPLKTEPQDQDQDAARREGSTSTSDEQGS